jgi:Class III cytochrome C family
MHVLIRMRPVSMLAALAPALLLGEGTAAAQARPPAAQVVQCAKCHADHDFIAANARGPGQDTLLYVPPDVLEGTAHQGLACTDCHRGFEAGFPHTASQMVVPCATCHEQEGQDWSASIHAVNAVTVGDAPTCVSCHGSHRVLPKSNPQSPTYPLNVAGLCGRCHGDARIIGRYFVGAGSEQARIATTAFPESVHGIALTRDGLVVSATCSDCHTAHKILPADSAESSVSRANIPATCGTCHAGVLRVFNASAHGPDYPEQPGVTNPHPKPVCVDCHSAHEIAPADQPAWQLGTVQKCGSCHESLYETYFETYHGQIAELGFNLAAKCSDCHTAHNMRPATDPQSTVFAGNLVATCSQCHEGANANFVKYYAHGDPTQRTRYPLLYWPWLFMTLLLAGVMTFFGVHSVLWLTRRGIQAVGSRRSARASSGGPEPHDGPEDT